MSDGKVLVEKDAGTTFEVLVEIDRKYKVVSKRLDAIEKNLELVQMNIVSLGSLQTSHDALDAKTSKIQEDAQSSIAELKSQREKDSAKLIDHGIALSDLGRALTSFRSGVHEQFESSKADLADFNEKHCYLKTISLNKHDFDRHVKAQNDRFSELQAIFEDAKKQISRLQSEKDQVEGVVSSHKNLHKAHEEKLSCLESSLAKQNSIQSAKISEVQQLVENKVQGCFQKTQKIIEETKAEMIGSPSSLEGAKKELLEKFESVALDASNALLRAKNSDQKISLMDRKIENIQLLLKKHELKE